MDDIMSNLYQFVGHGLEAFKDEITSGPLYEQADGPPERLDATLIRRALMFCYFTTDMSSVGDLTLVNAALSHVYLLGYRAGQEAQALAAADDTGGVDWSGEIR